MKKWIAPMLAASIVALSSAMLEEHKRVTDGSVARLMNSVLAIEYTFEGRVTGGGSAVVVDVHPDGSLNGKMEKSRATGLKAQAKKAKTLRRSKPWRPKGKQK